MGSPNEPLEPAYERDLDEFVRSGNWQAPLTVEDGFRLLASLQNVNTALGMLVIEMGQAGTIRPEKYDTIRSTVESAMDSSTEFLREMMKRNRQ